ncbi:MAG: AMP-binding protein [Actinobacteria bacterium]|nr:AMP-binding protein [Actinomycetota bacterium]
MQRQRFEVAWSPAPEYVQGSNLQRLLDRHGIAAFEDLRARSIEEPEWFWAAVVDDLGIPFHDPYEHVVDTSAGLAWATWFVGGTLNVADVCVDRWVRERRGDAPAVRWVGEDGSAVTLSYAQLAREVNRLANGLAGLGVEPGDAVGVLLPMVPEAVTAVYAIAKLGAICVPIFSGFAAPAVAVRLRDAGAKVVITADRTWRRGRTVPLKSIADHAVAACPAVQRIVVVRRTGDPDVPSDETRDVWLDDLVATASDHREPAWVPSEHPFLLAYSSGTTGEPKGAVHVHGGFTVKIAEEVAYQVDLRSGHGDRRGDLLWWPTDMGWIMGPWEVIGGHANGGTVLLFEGAPNHPRPDRIWEVCAEERVTILGCSPTLIRALQADGDDWVAGHDLSALRIFASSGEPWNPSPWWWLFETVGGRQRPIINLSGGTEVGACFLSPHPLEPIKPTSLGGPALGMAVDVIGADGAPVPRGQVGELVCRRPWPGMTRGLWRAPDRYLQTYWSRFEGMWWHGDFASVDEDGFWYLHGRSDDTLNVAGKRIGPAEIESVLVGHDAVREAAVVGLPDDVKGEAVVCLVMLTPAAEPTERLRLELSEAVTAALGKAFTPRELRFVTDLPRTRSAKIIRRAVRAVLQGHDPGDLATMENPEALDAIRAAS